MNINGSASVLARGLTFTFSGHVLKTASGNGRLPDRVVMLIVSGNLRHAPLERKYED